MAVKQRSRASAAEFRWEYGKLIPRAVIRDFARQIAEQFQPEKIILFGSYAYGKPHKDSDVDILVVMPAYNESNQAVRIKQKTDHHFPLDLVVRTPENLRWRLEEGDWFLREIVSKGDVLYEKTHSRLARKAESDLRAARKLAKDRPPCHDEACFHCQQAAEKFFKALLQEWGLHMPRTHDLDTLLDLLLPRDSTLALLRRGLKRLTQYAVDYRYPGLPADTRQVHTAIRRTERIRAEIRRRLGLRTRD